MKEITVLLDLVTDRIRAEGESREAYHDGQ